MTIRNSINWAKEQLKYACEQPRFEAEILLMYYLGVDRPYLMLHEDDEVADISVYEILVARRASHEPMEYITGKADFYDFELSVSPAVLIPRPETELLVDKVAEIVSRGECMNIAEIGIGSGAISIALARKFPDLKIVASDISKEALEIARINIERYGLTDRIRLVHTSLLDGIDNRFDMIVSNPPYIPKSTPLAPNVAEYEPHTALYSGEEGSELLREIILLAKERRVKYLACEMGYDQKKPIESFARGIGEESIEFYKDYSGLDRGFVVRFE